MTVQVLVATMNQSDFSLLEKMNIQTDAIVCNQCERNEFFDFSYKNRCVRWLSFKEKGVGLNRNNALMRATGDIILFADDDVVYYDGYEEIITQYYETHPKADVVIFNFKMRRGNTAFYDRVTKEGRVYKKGAMKYGTYCISIRREKLKFANIYFHQDFGGGSTYSCGEDSIFLQECIRKNLKVYSCKTIIGVLDHGPSTWFGEYTEKYFFDKGVLFYKLDKHFCTGIAIYHCIKYRKKYSSYGWKKALYQMKKGIYHAKSLI